VISAFYGYFCNVVRLGFHVVRLMRAMSPNSVIIVPEILFTHFSWFELNFEWNKPTNPVRMSHHRTEPMNTPRTSVAALL